jgi:phosphatidylglycerophosphatase A
MGVGRFPVAPGTAATLVGIAVYLVFQVQPHGIYLVSLLALMALAIWAADRAEGLLGQRDPSVIVIDEVVGFLVTLAWLPLNPYAVLLGFFLFRVFDISKVPPIRWIERTFPGGVGVVADDVVAGLYANLSLRCILKMVEIV